MRLEGTGDDMAGAMQRAGIMPLMDSIEFKEDHQAMGLVADVFFSQ